MLALQKDGSMKTQHLHWAECVTQGQVKIAIPISRDMVLEFNITFKRKSQKLVSELDYREEYLITGR